MVTAANQNGSSLKTNLRFKKLSIEQINRIDALLDSVGEYGEVHLIVQRGELRYFNRIESYKAWEPDEPAVLTKKATHS